MATHSSVLAWRIPGTGEPSGLPSMWSHRVGHDWSDLAAAAASLMAQSICNDGVDVCNRPGFDPWVGKIPWRRERLPTPVFQSGESHGLYSPQGHKESDTALLMFTLYVHTQWNPNSRGKESLSAGLTDIPQTTERYPAQSRHCMHAHWLLRVESSPVSISSLPAWHAPYVDVKDASVQAGWELCDSSNFKSPYVCSHGQGHPLCPAATHAPLPIRREILLTRQKNQVRETKTSFGLWEMEMGLNRNSI